MFTTKLPPICGFGFTDETVKDFDKFFKDFDKNFTGKNFQGFNPFSPKMNFKETDSSYVAEMQVPGVSKDDIEISLSDNKISISYENKKEEESDGAKYKKIEFIKKSSFSRSFNLPKNSDLDSVTSKCENGILYIEMQKKESDKKSSRTIEVK